MQTIKMAESLKMGISNDTGCGHLLSYTGIPILTLFGPTSAEKFSPIGNPKIFQFHLKKFSNQRI